MSLHYVTDPEELLTEPGYIGALLLAPGSRRWRLRVLEDAGELLAPDARERAGGLARLLNLTDGLVGRRGRGRRVAARPRRARAGSSRHAGRALRAPGGTAGTAPAASRRVRASDSTSAPDSPDGSDEEALTA